MMRVKKIITHKTKSKSGQVWFGEWYHRKAKGTWRNRRTGKVAFGDIEKTRHHYYGETGKVRAGPSFSSSDAEIANALRRASMVKRK